MRLALVAVLLALSGCAALGIDPAVPNQACDFAEKVCQGLDPVPPPEVVSLVDRAQGVTSGMSYCDWARLACSAIATGDTSKVPAPPAAMTARVQAARAQGMIR